MIYSNLKRISDSSVNKFKEKSDSSVIRFKITSDSSNYNIINLLASYKLKYDASQNKLVLLIKDSSKTKIVQEETPLLHLVYQNQTEIPISIMEYSEQKFLKICITSSNASARNINLTASLISMNSTINFDAEFNFIKSQKIFLDNITIAKDEIYCNKISIKNSPVPEVFVFWIRGTYLNNDLTKSFVYDEVIYYNVSKNETGMFSNETKKILKTLVQKSEL